MNRRSATWLTVLVVSVSAGFFFASTAELFAVETGEKKAPAKISPRVLLPVKTAESRPLREHLTRPPPATGPIKIRPEIPPHTVKAAPEVPRPQDPAVQRSVPRPNMPSPIENFEAQNQTCGCRLPPDTNAAVGPNEVVQTVNFTTQIWDKSGNDLSGGPFNTTDFWADFRGLCETINGGDPVVLYDQLADRWIVSLLAQDWGTPDFQQCMAVSMTGDPLGSYHQYAYDFGTTFEDYPKMAVWPDAYHLTARQIKLSGTAPLFFGGMAAVAFDRAAMLAGLPATAIFEDVGLILPDLDGLLASNLQGSTLPPSAGPTAANTLVGLGHPDLDGSPDSRLHLFYFHPDFTTPANSTFTGPVDISVDAFDPTFPGTPYDGYVSAIPQPNGAPALEVLPFILYPLNYRNFGGYESMVINHNVNVGGGQAGVRWYELRNPRGLAPSGGMPTVYQQGTYAPADGENRWMSAIAMDASNDIAVGFSLSSTNTDPSIRYTGRLASDPPGDLSQGEAELIAGTGEQTFFKGAWGDYSSLYTDPVDECKFWCTQEYIQTTGVFKWRTRIGSFKFPSCTTPPTGTLKGTVDDGANPIAGATITAGASSTVTDAAGHYQFRLPVNTYELAATKYGYICPACPVTVAVTDGGDTIQNFTLSLLPTTMVSGTVTDGSGQGWPLYAKLVITAPGAPTFTVYTDPVTGAYSKSLANGFSYNFSVSSPGYNTATTTVSLVPFGATVPQDFSLTIDTSSCSAPGYNPTTCQPGTGGLVVGNVHAANTSFGFNGATITNTTSGGATASFATPNDSNQDDGFYILFAPPDAQTLYASLPPFADDIQTLTVAVRSVIRQDFSLRFLDVPDSSIYANFIYGLAGSGITAGCGGYNYCPDASVTRAEMAVFIEKAKYGPSSVPSACTPPGIFGDVPCPGGFAVNFIEALYNDGITAGCSATQLLFCPNDPVTRAQMAVFIERAVHGPNYDPPCTGIFEDVPCPGGFAVGFIEGLVNDRIAVGCSVGPPRLFCPAANETRAQMAVFIVRAFNIPYL